MKADERRLFVQLWLHPARMNAAFAEMRYEDYGEVRAGTSGREGAGHGSGLTFVRRLASRIVSFGVNCVSSLEQHLAAARTVGISQQDITTIVKLAAFIRGKAASHVERLAGVIEEQEEVSYDAAVGAWS